jgi:hypothetical protein
MAVAQVQAGPEQLTIYGGIERSGLGTTITRGPSNYDIEMTAKGQADACPKTH